MGVCWHVLNKTTKTWWSERMILLDMSTMGTFVHVTIMICECNSRPETTQRDACVPALAACVSCVSFVVECVWRMLSSITDRWPQTNATAPRITKTDNATQTVALCLKTVESIIHIQPTNGIHFFHPIFFEFYFMIMTLRCDYFIFKFFSLISLRFPRSSFCFLLGSDRSFVHRELS